MKKICLFLLFLCFAQVMFAQFNTASNGNDIYYTKGNVGIGMLPNAPLDVNGMSQHQFPCSWSISR